ITLHVRGKRRPVEVSPDIGNPGRPTEPALFTEEVSDVHLALVDPVHVRIIVERYTKWLTRVGPLHVLKLPRNLQYAEDLVVQRSGSDPRHAEIIRSLRPNQPLTSYKELVPLGLTTKDGVVLKDEGLLTTAGGSEEVVRCAQATETAAHDH